MRIQAEGFTSDGRKQSGTGAPGPKPAPGGKPDPAAYEEALGALGARPAETLFVDDKERNLVPARAMGIQVHRFTDPPALREDLTARGLLVA